MPLSASLYVHAFFYGWYTMYPSNKVASHIVAPHKVAASKVTSNKVASKRAHIRWWVEYTNNPLCTEHQRFHTFT